MITHCGRQGLKAACKVWANPCSLDPSCFWHPDLFTWALLLQAQGEFSHSAHELCHRSSLCHVASVLPCLALHWPRFTWNYRGCFSHFPVEWHSAQPSALHTAGWLLSGQLCSRGLTPMFAQRWGTSASLRTKLISLGLQLCFDLSEWSWATAGQHGQCWWRTPRLTAPCGGARGVSSNSTELPGLVPSLPLVSALKKKTDVVILGNDRTENPANFQCLPRINVSLTEIFFPLDLP